MYVSQNIILFYYNIIANYLHNKLMESNNINMGYIIKTLVINLNTASNYSQQMDVYYYKFKNYYSTINRR